MMLRLHWQRRLIHERGRQVRATRPRLLPVVLLLRPVDHPLNRSPHEALLQ